MDSCHTESPICLVVLFLSYFLSRFIFGYCHTNPQYEFCHCFCHFSFFSSLGLLPYLVPNLTCFSPSFSFSLIFVSLHIHTESPIRLVSLLFSLFLVVFFSGTIAILNPLFDLFHCFSHFSRCFLLWDNCHTKSLIRFVSHVFSLRLLPYLIPIIDLEYFKHTTRRVFVVEQQRETPIPPRLLCFALLQKDHMESMPRGCDGLVRVRIFLPSGRRRFQRRCARDREESSRAYTVSQQQQRLCQRGVH